MSLITAPELLRTPNGYPQDWKRVFEVLVSPIILVREIAERASNNSWRDKAAGKNADPWLSPEEFKEFGDKALSVRQQMREVLDQINGIAERTWRAGREIRTSTGRVLFPLTDEFRTNRYPEPILARVQKGIIDASLNYLPIPFLITLREAIAAEQSITLSNARTQSGTSGPVIQPARSKRSPRRTTQVTTCDPSAYRRGLNCRNHRVKTHKQLLAFLKRFPNSEQGIRHDHRGQHLWVYGPDWDRRNEELDALEEAARRRVEESDPHADAYTRALEVRKPEIRDEVLAKSLAKLRSKK
jgi:hypothetical protein